MNKKYPGKWQTKLQQYFSADEQAVSIVHIYSDESEYRSYVTSIYSFKDAKILNVEKYWFIVKDAPEWRKMYLKK